MCANRYFYDIWEWNQKRNNINSVNRGIKKTVAAQQPAQTINWYFQRIFVFSFFLLCSAAKRRRRETSKRWKQIPLQPFRPVLFRTTNCPHLKTGQGIFIYEEVPCKAVSFRICAATGSRRNFRNSNIVIQAQIDYIFEKMIDVIVPIFGEVAIFIPKHLRSGLGTLNVFSIKCLFSRQTSFLIYRIDDSNFQVDK